MRLMMTVGLIAATLIPLSLSDAHAEDASSTAPPSGTSAADLGLQDLTDDLSRQDLFSEVKTASINQEGAVSDSDITFFNLWGPFRFPNDVDFDAALQKPRDNSIFGVDISHYTSLGFPIENLRQKKVRFVYMKATQGTGYLDDHFAQFWARAGSLPQGSEVHRGAYHFLSAGDPTTPPRAWGAAQAKTFVKVIHANKGLRKTDMPPVVDLEWDKASANGPDRWAQRSPSDILEVVLGFVEQVKSDLGVAPMVYTARSWWSERIGSDAMVDKLSGYPLWDADYSRRARASEIPKTIHNQAWALWQYTDGATMAIGFSKPFDANIYKGDEASFYKTFHVEQFQ
jgi:lysozyme